VKRVVLEPSGFGKQRPVGNWRFTDHSGRALQCDMARKEYRDTDKCSAEQLGLLEILQQAV
jgi:hypothetical protein